MNESLADYVSNIIASVLLEKIIKLTIIFFEMNILKLKKFYRRIIFFNFKRGQNSFIKKFSLDKYRRKICYL